MLDAPEHMLNPKIKLAWRLSALVWMIICAAPFFALYLVLEHFDLLLGYSQLVLAVLCGILAACALFFLVILPAMRFRRWRYGISERYVQIQRGIFWRKNFLVPFIRVQDTYTRRGPILRMLGLSDVTLSTAAGEHVIPGLDKITAQELRDRSAEFARIAREEL